MLQTCRRHPGHLFALSCPGCKQDIHDKQYPEYATNRTRPAAATAAMKAQPTVADLRIAAVTAVGVAVITAPTPVLDPSVAYQLQIIDECRPAIANLERALNMRRWRQDDIGTSMLRQLELDRQAVHIAEERLLDLYGMPRLTATR